MVTHNHIGVDFGTTNTILSFFDETDGPQLHVVTFGQPDGATRSRLVESRKGGIWKIIRSVFSIDMYKDRDVTIRENFKMELPQSGGLASVREKNESFVAAREFMGAIIKDFNTNGSGDIGSLCISVPEPWIGGQEQVATEAIRQISRNLRLPSPTIISEPVAAASFFAHRYRQRTNQSFRGHALIYDHGGGTLDLSLVRIDSNRVIPITGDGLSIEDDPRGYGGVAFDKMMLEFYKEEFPKMREFSDSYDKVWLHKFEEFKRQSSIDLEEQYKRILANHHDVEPELFEVDDVKGTRVTVSPRNIFMIFNKRYRPKLETRLRKFLDHCLTLDNPPDFRDASKFRVLMVGGFAEYYPVRQMVEQVLRSHYGADNDVFENYLTRNDRWSAIARGACLVAANQIRVDELCPCTFGIVSYDDDNKERYHPLVVRGEPVQNYDEVVYFEDGEFNVDEPNPDNVPEMTFYLERAGENVAITGKSRMSDLLPDFGHAKSWRFGASIANGVITIYIKSNTSSQPRRIPLGEFFDLIEASENKSIDDSDRAAVA